MKMTKLITKALILVTPVIWIGYDLYAFFHSGNSATESATLFRWSFRAPGLAFLIGVLCGHLFMPQTQVVDELAQNLTKKD